MLMPKDTAHFRRDFKRLKKDGYDMQQLHTVVNLIAEEGHKELLRSRCHDHALSSSSEWRGYRELHITPDWLLIYRIVKKDLILVLVRTGSHKELISK